MTQAGCNLSELAQAAMQGERYREAIAFYDQCIVQEPNNYHYYFNLAIAHQMSGDGPNAINAYLRALSIDITSFGAANNAAILYQGMGYPEKSIEVLRAFLAHNRNNLNATLNLGSLLMELRRPGEAIENYEDLLVMRPGDPSATTNLVAIMSLIGQGRRATPFIARWIRLHPDDPNALHAMGYNLFTYHQNYAEATRYYEAALALDPASTSYKINLIKSLQAEGKHEAARALVQTLNADGNDLKSLRMSKLPSYA